MTNPRAVSRAIIQGRRPGRVSVFLILGLIVAGLCLMVVFVLSLLGTSFISPILFFLALPTTIFYLGVVLYIDRLEPEPKLLLLFVFLWGAGTAILIAGELNSFNEAHILVPAFGKTIGSQLTASLSAPFVEETLKAMPLFFLLWRRRHELNGVTDAIVYASVSALGFALVENVQYYLSGLAEGLSMGTFEQGVIGLGKVIALRGLFSPLCHPMFTSMTALGVVYAANHRGAKTVFAVIGGWVGAMCLHSLWNTGTVLSYLAGISPRAFGGYLLLVPQYVFFMGVLAFYVVLLVRDRRRVVGLIQRHLPQYSGTGAVTQSDTQMLGTLKARKEARSYIRSRYGLRAMQAMTDYQLTATELALLHDRAEKGGIEPPQFHQRQNELVQVLTTTYSTAMGGPDVAPAPWQVGGPQAPPQGYQQPPPPAPRMPQGPPPGSPPEPGPRQRPPFPPTDGPPPPGAPPRGYPPQGPPPQGRPPQPGPYPPQGPPPQGRPPQPGPYPPQGRPPQGRPRQGPPPQGRPPQGPPPQGPPPYR